MKDAQRKLSKRHGDASYEDFIKRGFLKEAILNYIALLGWNPRGEREIFTLGELIGEFDVDGLSKSPAIFDEAKLTWMNAEYIRALDGTAFEKAAMPYYEQVLHPNAAQCAILRSILQPRLEVLTQIPEKIAFLRALPGYDAALFVHQKMKTTKEMSLLVLQAAKERLEALGDWTEQGIHETLLGIVDSLSLKNGQVFWPVRIALTGMQVSPGGADEAAALLGREESLERLATGIEKLTEGAGS
jgi:glutamyl-tRNA synthetase